jgi:hypothetical protein
MASPKLSLKDLLSYINNLILCPEIQLSPYKNSPTAPHNRQQSVIQELACLIYLLPVLRALLHLLLSQIPIMQFVKTLLTLGAVFCVPLGQVNAAPTTPNITISEHKPGNSTSNSTMSEIDPRWPIENMEEMVRCLKKFRQGKSASSFSFLHLSCLSLDISPFLQI